MAITAHSRVRLSAGTYASKVEHGAVVMNLPSGCYFALNETGFALWERLSTINKLSEVLVSLQEVWPDVDIAELEQDLIAFTRTLTEKGLLEIES